VEREGRDVLNKYNYTVVPHAGFGLNTRALFFQKFPIPPLQGSNFFNQTVESQKMPNKNACTVFSASFCVSRGYKIWSVLFPVPLDKLE